MNDLNPKALESDLGLEGYGAVIVVAEKDETRNLYLPFSQVREFYGIIHRGSFNGLKVVEGARSIMPTSRRALDVMKDGRSHRTTVIGYVKKEAAEFPAPLDVLYSQNGNIWRRGRGGKVSRLDHKVEEFKSRGLFIPSKRRFTISLTDHSEFAYGLHPEVVVVDDEDGIRQTIQHVLEYQGLPPHYYSKLLNYLQAL